MQIKILDTGPASAADNMAIDSVLLRDIAREAHPILHFYEWSSPAATYGHFIQPQDFLTEGADKQLDLAKRPTGGGIIFHLTDLAFSMLIPASHPWYSTNTLANYEVINKRIMEAILKLKTDIAPPMLLPHETEPLDAACQSFCMAKPTIYDVMIGNKKAAGGAQRRTKEGFLHQGSIHIAIPQYSAIQCVLKPGTCIYDSMMQHSYSILGATYTPQELADCRASLKSVLIDTMLLAAT